MATRRVLVIEDEEDILELVSFHLKKDGYDVVGVTSAEDGLRALRLSSFDVIVLDRMLPGMDGLDFCRRIKQEHATSAIPVIMLTAKSDESDIITGLEMGADDYVTKPFSPKILLARARTVLRRQAPAAQDDIGAYAIRNLRIHPGRFEVRAQGTPIELTLSEFRILHLLARRPGWVFSRAQIVEAVRGEDHDVTERSVDVHIVGLRKKLGEAGRDIETVRGVGYRFKE